MSDFDAPARLREWIARKPEADASHNRLFKQQLEVGSVALDRGNALDAPPVTRAAHRAEVYGNCIYRSVQEIAFDWGKLSSAARRQPFAKERGSHRERIGRPKNDHGIGDLSAYAIESRVLQDDQPGRR